MGITRCRRNEVLVISGCCISEQKYVHSGSFALVLPGQKLQRLPTEVLNLYVETKNVVTRSDVPIFITSAAQARIIQDNDRLLKKASQNFGDKSSDEMKQIISDCIAESQIAVLGKWTPEEVVSEKKNFCREVYEEATCALVLYGVEMVSYTIKTHGDEHGYFVEMMREKREARLKEMMMEMKLDEESTAQKEMKLKERQLAEENRAQEVAEEMRLAEEKTAEKETKDAEEKAAEMAVEDRRLTEEMEARRVLEEEKDGRRELNDVEGKEDTKIVTKNNPAHQFEVDMESR